MKDDRCGASAGVAAVVLHAVRSNPREGSDDFGVPAPSNGMTQHTDHFVEERR